ncbi:MAG: FeoB-associated Cys-rich membrane protein [Oscillospiraceae bacterium]
MGTADWIALTLIGFAVFCAVFYMIKSRKNGKGCSGCPYSGSCGKSSDKICKHSESKKGS